MAEQNVTDDVRKLVRRIKIKALGEKANVEATTPSAESTCSALEYASSEEEEERALNESFYFGNDPKNTTSPKRSPERKQRINLEKISKDRAAKKRAVEEN